MNFKIKSPPLRHSPPPFALSLRPPLSSLLPSYFRDRSYGHPPNKAPGTRRHQAQGTRHKAPGTRHKAPVSRHHAQDTRSGSFAGSGFGTGLGFAFGAGVGGGGELRLATPVGHGPGRDARCRTGTVSGDRLRPCPPPRGPTSPRPSQLSPGSTATKPRKHYFQELVWLLLGVVPSSH